MPLPQHSGVLFDCDGTLVDTLGDAMGSFMYAFEQVGSGALPEGDLRHRFGQSADKILLQLIGDQAKAHEAFGHYLEHQTKLAQSAPLHAGIRELLDQLRQAGVPLGLVTGRHALDLELILKPHDLAPYFAVLVADSQLARPKPAPDGLLLACNTLGLDPARTLYVGDSVNDLLAAHAAGCVPVAALWDGLANEEELAAGKPACLARVPADVKRFAWELWGRG